MSATVDTQTDWQAQIVRLKAEDPNRTSADIAEIVGKHAGTVRKVLKRNEYDIGEAAAHLRTHTEAGPIPGQTTVDDHLNEVPPEDDPEHPDALAEFRQQAGEPVGDMPSQPEPDPVDYEVRLRGTRQMALDFGDNAEEPVGGTLKLKSDTLASGFYGLGDVIQGTFTARIVDVVGKERFQRASEEFRVQPQQHVALITEVSLAVEDEG